MVGRCGGRRGFCGCRLSWRQRAALVFWMVRIVLSQLVQLLLRVTLLIKRRRCHQDDAWFVYLNLFFLHRRLNYFLIDRWLGD